MGELRNTIVRDQTNWESNAAVKDIGGEEGFLTLADTFLCDIYFS